MEFKITSKYQPTGDQPQAIRQLTQGVEQGDPAQVLLGVTGSGKTFTVANVIANVGKPTLILSHNKTLAAQLYQEMKGFFPENAVEYYVSYYDYYQPEAYLPTTDTYIEKDLAINEEIDKLRLGAVSALLSGRKDVIVVSSVSCIYGMGGPTAMQENIIKIKKGQILVERFYAMVGERIDFLDTVDFIVPPGNSQYIVTVGHEDINSFSFHPEVASLQFNVFLHTAHQPVGAGIHCGPVSVLSLS